MGRYRILAWVIGMVAAVHPVSLKAQVKRPPAPKTYRVELRYSVPAPFEQRVKFLGRMHARLRELQFKYDPPLQRSIFAEAADRFKDRLTGTIPGDKARALLQVPFVENVLLVPATYQLPQDPAAPVTVQLELLDRLLLDQQIALREQALAILRFYGFQEHYGYDHRSPRGQPFALIRGTIPAEYVRILLKDLRRLPTGWFGSLVSNGDLPVPLAQHNPVRLVEVLPDPQPAARPVEIPQGLGIIAADLWSRIRQDQPLKQPLRIELVFKGPVDEFPDLEGQLRTAAPHFVVEGSLGNIVWGVFGSPRIGESGLPLADNIRVGNEILTLARWDALDTIRLPVRATRGAAGVAFTAETDAALKATGLAALHAGGFRGKGVRMAVIGEDFAGWDAMVAQGKLPPKTRLIDLTIERNRNLLPDPWQTVLGNLGQGTQCAMAASRAAPEAELLLVRVDPAAPYMLVRALGLARGRGVFSAELERRFGEVRKIGRDIAQKRKSLLEERRRVLDYFNVPLEGLEQYEFLGVVRDWVFDPQRWSTRRFEELATAYRAQLALEERLRDYVAALESLKGVDVVVSTLTWQTGHPIGGRSALTLALDRLLREGRGNRNAGHVLWVQGGGDQGGQVWHGPFADSDGNGAAELTKGQVPPGRWNRELAFLGWEAYDGQRTTPLPGGTRLRICVQWTEPHDPDYYYRKSEKDWYQRPLADFYLVVLRQRDPAGRVLPSDVLEVVARTSEPVRIANTPTSSTYEMSAEFTTEPGGVYAIQMIQPKSRRWALIRENGSFRYVQLRFAQAAGITPVGAPSLPALEKRWQLEPRIYVEAVAGVAASTGRPVLADYATDYGTTALPGDSRSAITVAAAKSDGRPEPFASLGPPAGVGLFTSPAILAPWRVGPEKVVRGPAIGSPRAAAVTGGYIASLLSKGLQAEELRRMLTSGATRQFLRPVENSRP